ncbi:DUF2793 domain-containing protein [Actibacterium lipolyticum]|uniref:DUF2793 domain-containing protein n=1 Tax=Actibacterium lipolyticum TaxID=1524263 RepID=A0A238KH26_9RHOB|nr:DUF2793 domain-containing protein [Actibacterium lipolyticum]SMX42007.1 hypothetical protein COL8621_01870 [Actibacterium lipolyticum]
MNETTKLQLPLVQAAQAQKHVTVNEGLLRLDGLVQLRLISLSVATPPAAAVDGDCYAVPLGAVNGWAGHDGEIAIQSGGGWVFAMPQIGWRGWDVANTAEVVFDGEEWVPGVAAMSASGAATRFHVMEFDHVITPGSVNATLETVPSHAMVFGVTARVVSAITGTLSAWRLGADGSDNRFGSGLGLSQGSYARGVMGAPLTGYSTMPLDLTAEGGDFATGTVRLAVHYCELTLPGL